MAGRALRMEPKRDSTSEAQVTPIDESTTRTRAYELWMARGCPNGSDREDWFNAEQELMRRAAEQ